MEMSLKTVHHEKRVNILAQKLATARNPIRKRWLSWRLDAHERAHDNLVAQRILAATPEEIRMLRGAREMYHTQDDAVRGYKTTRAGEVVDELVFVGSVAIGLLGIVHGHMPVPLEVGTGTAFVLSLANAVVDVTHDEQYATIAKAHTVLDNAGLRSPVKAYRRA